MRASCMDLYTTTTTTIVTDASAPASVPTAPVWTPPEYGSFTPISTSTSPPPPPPLLGKLKITADIARWPHDFARSAKWCPDGSAFLTTSENRAFEVFYTPDDALGALLPSSTSAIQTRLFRQAAPIVAYAWYPTARLADHASFCFAASVREQPVQLLDARDGRLRASYPIVDHRERQIAPHSLAFNPSAQKLYCGYEDAIAIFDVGRPGWEGVTLRTTPAKRSKDGLKGIISALAFAPPPYFDAYNTDTATDAAPTSDLFAAGSITPAAGIALFQENQQGDARGASLGVPLMYLDGGPGGGASVQQLLFNPLNSNILYASYRLPRSRTREPEIYAWDLRNRRGLPIEMFSPPPSAPASLGGVGVGGSGGDRDGKIGNGEYGRRGGGDERASEKTNQKLTFDVDITGRWLGVGDERGNVTVYPANHTFESLGFEAAGEGSVEEWLGNPLEVAPVRMWRGHHDAVGSVSFHPLKSVVLTTSGSRYFRDPCEFEESEEEEDEEEEEEEEESEEDVGMDTEKDADVEMEMEMGKKHQQQDAGTGTGSDEAEKMEDVKQAKTKTNVREMAGEGEKKKDRRIRIPTKRKLQPLVVDSSIKLWDCAAAPSSASG